MSPLWIVLLLPALALGERFSCRGRILGAYYADVKSGCRAFHVCVRVSGGGVRDFRFFCPPGTLFQQEAQTCTDWGDDDGLACPADLYDGSFDLYKIGSGFDTKKTSGVEKDEDFALQRAETGDRRLSQNDDRRSNQNDDRKLNQAQNDLRASHSSDFFSGRRDRGRDDFVESPSSPQPSPTTRVPYRRPPPRSTHAVTTYASPSTANPVTSHYEQQHKRKLIRKRPIYASTTLTPVEITTKYFRSSRPDSPTISTASPIVVNEDIGFIDVVKVSPKAVGRYDAPSEKKYTPKPGLTEVYNYNAESTPNYFKSQDYKQHNFNHQNNHNFNQHNNDNAQNNFNGNVSPNANFNQNYPKTQKTPIVNYKNPNLQTPNQANQNFNNANNQNNNNQNNFQNLSFNQQSNDFSKENNFNSQNINNQNTAISTSNQNVQNAPSENARNFKATVRNSFNVAAPSDFENQVRKNVEVSPNGIQRQTTLDNARFASSTPTFRNINSVSYDDIKSKKQNIVSTTTKYEQTRSTAALNLNTVAYKTDIGFDARPGNFAESDEDDGQYRLPSGEDDGQYRPELYERDSELLSGAHSLNIAASGKSRVHEDQKPRRPVAQTSAPRPFSSAPTELQTTAKPQQRLQPTTFQTYPSIAQTQQPNYQSHNTLRQEVSSTTFEYDNSVFTTRRPITPSVPTTPRPNTARPQQKSSPSQQKASSVYSKPVSKKEDTSYDYAYYDTDSGFSEYDQIEEFEKTKKKA